MKMINEHARISKSTEILEAPLDDSLALMSIENGKYYGLNSVGRVIWESLENEISFKEIVDLLIVRFEIEEKECINQCTTFLNELEERNIIKISS